MTLFNQPAVHSNTPLSQQEKLNWLRLFRTDTVGPITFYALLERFGTATKALEALPELASRGGRKKALVAPPLSMAEKEYERLLKLGGDIVCVSEALYPLALAAIEDAPPILSYIGDIKMAKLPCLAIVGARNASLNGINFSKKLSHDLGQTGQIIVSGLARGIDTAAHNGALQTGTIAVIAGGIDVVYPSENKKLYDKICEQGLVIAESPLSVEPIARHFPKRNRIVSGLSAGVVVIEATYRSGSLITARMAAEQGRDVYAVPGYPLDPRSQGPNKLIQDGAVLVQTADDILNTLSSYSGGHSLKDSAHQSIQKHYNPANDKAVYDERVIPENAREVILQNLSHMPLGIDELINACHLTIPEVQMILLELEIAGRLQRLAGNRVALLN